MAQSSSTSITSAISTAAGAIASNAIPVLGVVDDGLKVATETIKLVEQETTLHNSPAIVSASVAAEIKDLRSKVEAETAENNLEVDQEGSGS